VSSDEGSAIAPTRPLEVPRDDKTELFG